jgi:hypothetical protein
MQATPLPHEVPSCWGGFEHVPVDGEHVPATWHESSGVQLTVVVGEPQAPFWQVSPLVQALTSSHAAPLALFGLVQMPVPGSQAPARWHWSIAEQVVVAVGEPQEPFWQVSPLVQALPSLQTVPLALFGLLQVPVAGSQLPARWH